MELRTWDRIAVWQVQASDNHSVDDSLNVSTLVVVLAAGQPTSRLKRLLTTCKDRDTVPRFLAMPYRSIACAFQLFARKFIGRCLQFLQTDDTRSCLVQPTKEDVEATVDAVYVKGGEFHRHMSALAITFVALA
ncbi:conserved hypothetical protein [Agrobacterium fabacearum S56]|nr:conserved hypothetical protein [Agrobacterium fabacearum S56]